MSGSLDVCPALSLPPRASRLRPEGRSPPRPAAAARAPPALRCPAPAALPAAAVDTCLTRGRAGGFLRGAMRSSRGRRAATGFAVLTALSDCTVGTGAEASLDPLVPCSLPLLTSVKVASSGLVPAQRLACGGGHRQRSLGGAHEMKESSMIRGTGAVCSLDTMASSTRPMHCSVSRS